MISAPIQRRTFLTLLGGAAAAWPLAARAQQRPVPVVGLLNGVPFDAFADRVAAWRAGLAGTGFVEGQNVSIEYRSADGHAERLPQLAADLVRREVNVIVAIGTDAPVRAAKVATSRIPIVFAAGGEAVSDGIVASLNRPEANVTGMSFDNSALGPKRLDLMRELLPQGILIAFLTSSGLTPDTQAAAGLVVAAGRKLGRQIVVLNAGTRQEIDEAFSAIVQQRIDALLVNNDAFLNTFRDQIIALAARHAIPTIYPNREYVRVGGLMSYGIEVLEMYRQAGIYTGRILKGEKPGDLPVMQPTRFEFVLNLKTAKALGLTIPLALQVSATEVIE